MSRVRLVDIAKALGLAKSTVSMALRGHPEIPEATREKVRAKALSMGYVPDPALRRLAEQRWKRDQRSASTSIAYVAWHAADYPDQRQKLRPFIRETARSLGYGYESLCVSDYPDPAAAVRVLQARGVAGVILHPTRYEQGWEGFDFEDFSGIEVLSGAGRPSGLSVVRQDSFSAMLEAGKKVRAAGLRSGAICLLKQPRPSRTDERDEAAAEQVLQSWRQAGLERAEILRLSISAQESSSVLIMPRLIQWIQSFHPEVLLLPTDGFIWGLDQAKIHVPADIQVIAMNGADEESRRIARFHRRDEAIALRAVQQLDSLIRSGTRGLPKYAETTVVPSLWLPGESFIEAVVR